MRPALDAAERNRVWLSLRLGVAQGHADAARAAALAGGVWLDVGEAESYSRAPLWPVALDLVQLLAHVAVTSTALTPTLLADRLTDLLHVTAPTTPAA